MTKRAFAGILCVLCAFAIGSAALAYEAADINLYLAAGEPEPNARYPQSAVVLEDTLYCLAASTTDQSLDLTRWQAGMSEPETVLSGALTAYACDADGRPLETNVTQLFTDGACVYGLDADTGGVKRLVSQNGRYSSENMYRLDFSPLNQAEGRGGGFAVSDLCVMDGSLYLLTDTYGERPLHTLSVYSLDTGECLSRTELARLQSIEPYKNGRLLCLWRSADSEYDEQSGLMIPNDIALFNPATQEAEIIVTSLAYGDTGLVYDAAGNSAYFVSNAVIYCLPGMHALPKVSAYLPVQVWSGGGQYFGLLNGEMYVYADRGYILVRALNKPGVEEGALVVRDDYETSAHRAVIAGHPDMNITLSAANYSTAEQVMNAMLSASSAPDVLTLDASLLPLQHMIDKGYAADLSASPTLMSVVEAMAPSLSACVLQDGRLYGLPVAMSALTFSVNLELWTETLGLSREELPKTMPQFLAFIGGFDARFGGAHPDIAIMDAFDMRGELLSEIIRQYVALTYRDTGALSFDTPLFRQLMAALDGVDFKPLDPYAALGEEVWTNTDVIDAFYSRQPLFSLHSIADSPAAYLDGAAALPFAVSLSEDCQPVIPATMRVMIVNPRTTRLEHALEYLNEYARHYAPLAEALALFPDAAPCQEVTAEMIAAYHRDISPWLYVMPPSPLTGEDASGIQYEIARYAQGAMTLDAFILTTNAQLAGE